MCERFGWTLEYWDGLSNADVNDVIAVWDGVEKARPKGGGKPAINMAAGRSPRFAEEQ